jgi:hypothetical protein
VRASRRRAGAAIGAAAVLAVLSGCGTPSADLFVVDRSGSIPGAHLRLLVSDGGTVECNGGKARQLPDPDLLTARELARRLDALAKESVNLPPARGSILRYSVRLEPGSVVFSDNSPGQTPELRQLALFTRRVAQHVCRLPR